MATRTEVSYPTFPNREVKISAHLNKPAGFDEKKKCGAVIVTHPASGCKEQTASIYAKELTGLGYVTLIADAAYQGDSGGEPRQIEYAPQRVEDISCGVDYLMTLDFIDETKVGVLGICAGGGYATAAAIKDHRIKALGLVSAVNMGRMQRESLLASGDPIKDLEGINAQRTAETRGGETLRVGFIPDTPEEAKKAGITSMDLVEAVDYYRTPRAQHKNSPNRLAVSSFGSLFGFDAFHLADHMLTQPLQIVVGKKVGVFGSYRDGYDLYNKARSENKNILELDASHFELYDKPEAVSEVMKTLGPFFNKHL